MFLNVIFICKSTVHLEWIFVSYSINRDPTSFFSCEKQLNEHSFPLGLQCQGFDKLNFQLCETAFVFSVLVHQTMGHVMLAFLFLFHFLFFCLPWRILDFSFHESLMSKVIEFLRSLLIDSKVDHCRNKQGYLLLMMISSHSTFQYVVKSHHHQGDHGKWEWRGQRTWPVPVALRSLYHFFFIFATVSLWWLSSFLLNSCHPSLFQLCTLYFLLMCYIK